MRPVLKLADGTLIVGDFTSMNVPMLAVTEFPVATIRWVKLDPMRVVTVSSPGNANNEIWVLTPDLSKVDEVGFADLMPASGHGTGGYIQLGSIEVGPPSASRRRDGQREVGSSNPCATTGRQNSRLPPLSYRHAAAFVRF